MRRKVMYGVICVSMAAMLFGCGSSATDNSVNDTDTKQESSGEAAVGDSSDDASSVQVDDSTGSWLLRNELTDKEVLDDVSGAKLFVDNLTLPISIDDLLSYNVKSAGGDMTTLSSEINGNTESFESKSYSVYDSTETDLRYLPDIVLGKEDSGTETTVKDAVEQGVWMLDSSYTYYKDFGLTEEEYNSLCEANYPESGSSSKYVFLDTLYEMLGSPNFVGWYYSTDNETRWADDAGNYNYDASEYIDRLRNPNAEDSDYDSFVNQFVVGWQFADYGIAIDFAEIVKEDKATANTDMIGITYIPSTYGTISDVYGANAVKDFIAAK
jgi:hypothetical protein